MTAARFRAIEPTEPAHSAPVLGEHPNMSIRSVTAAALAVALSAAAPAALAQSMVVFTVENHTGSTLTAIFAGPSSSDDWGYNILDVPTRNGEGVVVTLDTGAGGCWFDLRYEFADGDVFEEYEVDVCAISGQDYVLE